MNVHYNLFQNNETKEMILLHSNLTNTVFCNIRKSKKILCLNTNRGIMITNKICDVPHLGTH